MSTGIVKTEAWRSAPNPPFLHAFVNGQRVHVEFDGIVSVTTPHIIAVLTDTGAEMTINALYVTPLDPENWPPQVGDIWEVEGTEYYVRENRSGAGFGTIVVDRFTRAGRSFGESRLNGLANLDNLKALSPTLVRRRTR
jgi:hypothetical protein